MRISIPTEKNIFIILFVVAWLCGWFLGEVSAIKSLFSVGYHRNDSFLFFWLCAWTIGRRGKLYAQHKYEALLSCAQDAEFTGIWMAAYFSTIQRYASIVQFLNSEIKVIDSQIEELSAQLPKLNY
jgi:hypothetical protein